MTHYDNLTAAEAARLVIVYACFEDFLPHVDTLVANGAAWTWSPENDHEATLTMDGEVLLVVVAEPGLEEVIETEAWFRSLDTDM